MEANQFLGLVKFFRNESFLDSLISGCFHCTPSEVYRLDKQEGVSDKFESCAFSYRKERNDSPIILEINGLQITDLLGMTTQNGDDKDSWLHCWFTLRVPKDQEDLDNLKTDLEKMKTHFGRLYAFIPAPSLSPFIERLKIISREKCSCGTVKYSSNRSDWGTLCKSIIYSYQREYRFCFGECSTSEMEPYVINDDQGFEKFIYKNPELKFQSKDGTVTWFELSA